MGDFKHSTLAPKEEQRRFRWAASAHDFGGPWEAIHGPRKSHGWWNMECEIDECGSDVVDLTVHRPTDYNGGTVKSIFCELCLVLEWELPGFG